MVDVSLVDAVAFPQDARSAPTTLSSASMVTTALRAPPVTSPDLKRAWTPKLFGQGEVLIAAHRRRGSGSTATTARFGRGRWELDNSLWRQQWLVAGIYATSFTPACGTSNSWHSPM